MTLRLIHATCIVYVAALTILHTLQFTPLAAAWPLQLANVFRIWWYAPLLVLPLVAVLTRQWRVLLLLGVPLLALLWDYGAQLFPPLGPPPPAHVRVMTWNVRYDNQDARGVAGIVQQNNPDVLAIQELGTAIAPVLAAALRPTYPYQLLAPSDSPDGFGILSRYPITASVAPALGAADCRCQRAVIAHPLGALTVFNVPPHTPVVRYARLGPLPLPASFSTAQQDSSFATLVAQIRTTSGPRLVVGDLNTTDHQPNYVRLSAELTDAFAASGWGFGLTFPVNRRFGPTTLAPVLRLDYVFHDATLRSVSSWTGELLTADHRYVVADLVFTYSIPR